MKKRTNIFSKLQSTGKALLLLSKLALAAVILAAAVPQSVYAADTQTQGSSYKSAKDYYNAQESVSIKKTSQTFSTARAVPYTLPTANWATLKRA